MKKKIKKSDQRIELLKKTWVYPAGLILLVAFTTVLAAQNPVRENQKVNEVKGEVTTGSEKNVVSPLPSNQEIAEQPIVEKRAEAPVSQNQTATVSAIPVPQTPVAPVKKTAKVSIANLGSFIVEIKEGDNAFEILKRAAEEHNFVLDYSVDPRWGAFLNGIGGVQNNFKTGTYWTLYYNGKAAEVGASSININKNDVTEWRYESWGF